MSVKLTTIARTITDTASGHCLGIDLDVKPHDGQVVLRSMHKDWPKGWVEHGRYGRPKTLNHAWVLPHWQPTCDIFVFSDMYMHRRWQCEGITARNINSIISITIEKDRISFITADEISDASRIVLNAIEAVKSSHAYGELPQRLFAEPRYQYMLKRWNKHKKSAL